MRVYLLITDRCNLSCTMCIRGVNEKNDMSFKDFKKYILTKSFKDSELVITGGEPTLHKNFVNIVREAALFFKKVLIATNGTTNYYIDELKDIENLFFQISIDGDKKEHDSIRGKGSFNIIKQTLEKFEGEKLKYCIASVVGKSNKGKIDQLIPYLSSLSMMKYWRISYEMPFGIAKPQDMLTIEEWNNFVDKILKKVNFRLLIKKLFDFDLYDKHYSKLIKNENKCCNCGSGKNEIYVYPNLNVYPCTCLTDFCIGNLKESSINTVLNCKKNKEFTNYKIDKKLPCYECKYFPLCNGGCIGMSYNILGALGKGDVRCPILRRYYEKKSILL